ncbi:MAG TPA: energy transducer TonB [Dyella sp.]|nr:energy transducer TonB [Dyella sp.]
MTRPALAVVVLLLALAAAFVHAWWQRVHRDAAVPSPSTASAGTVARPADPLPADDLLRAARAAVAAQHLLAPAGDNAFERYLALRARSSSRTVAADALRELFPYAADQVGATIREGRLDEARRQLGLLTEADPGNYTLTLLRDQLAAREGQLAAQVAAAASRDVASLPSVSRPAPEPSVAIASAAEPTADPPAPAPVSRPPSTQVARATNPPTSHAVAAPPAPQVIAPVLLRRVEPYYPQAARRARREGWVEVAFTVLPDGRVDAVHVLQADPGSVFDLAATTAVRRWTFRPGTRNGQPVAMDLRQRLDFRL